LEEESAEEMLGVMLGNEASLRPLKKVILEKSEGVPFFIEEIVQALFDRGVLVRNGGVSLTRPTTEIHVPPTVQGMLAARIDRLQAEEKELLQTAAVAGREFSLALLERVTNRPADGLQRTLARLQAAEFVYEQPASTELDYVFKHALTQEVAYASVLLERRRQLHDRIA
jgi:predicted ATPase